MFIRRTTCRRKPDVDQENFETDGATWVCLFA